MPSWKTIELYKEFVTNGLDLLSFVLVTPEVLRAIGPPVGAISWRVVTLIASGGLLVIMTIPYQIFRDRFFPSGPSGFLESFIERAVGYVLLMIGAALVMLGLIFVGYCFSIARPMLTPRIQTERQFPGPIAGFWSVARATHLSDCINITPTTVPTMYMAQAERLNWTLVELNMKYSPRSAIPKLPAVASFAT